MTARSRLSGGLGAWAAALLVAAAPLALAVPASAAEGNIDHVEPGEGSFQVYYSLPGDGADATPDLSTMTVTLDGEAVEATAERAADATTQVRRTAVLAIDVSLSMKANDKFVEAKRAALAFLDAAPADLNVGIVTFASDVVVAQEPSTDRAASADVIDGLSLSRDTRLYDGVRVAVNTAGEEGSRSVLVLSDGRDTSTTRLQGTINVIQRRGVKVDVVALAQSPRDTAVLTRLTASGSGSVISADDPQALAGVFTDEATALANQILVTASAPAEVTEGTLAVSVEADGETYTDSAFVTIADAVVAPAPTLAPTTLAPAETTGLVVSEQLMFGGLAAAGLGVLVVLIAAFGGFGSRKATVEDRISAYTRRGSRQLAKANATPAPQGMTAQAVGVAERALESRAGISEKLALKLEGAGMSLKPAEWLLLHAGIAFALGLLGLLLGSGSIVLMLGALFVGLVGPWIFLSFKTSRRIKRFNGQLADTLQLMAGSLSAGLSLAQSVNTVVREGADPMAGEFRRAIIESRLGVDIEDALAGISERMHSKDFEWVVMAIRIQREVGGNLSELLNSVAATIREREYLERQVLALSAEGRLSVWILGGLPPVFMLYLLLTNRPYLEPLISTPIGYLALVVMAVLLTVGIFWMKKVVKVEV